MTKSDSELVSFIHTNKPTKLQLRTITSTASNLWGTIAARRLLHAGFFLGLFLNPEDGEDM
jgi:hypothetical protein